MLGLSGTVGPHGILAKSAWLDDLFLWDEVVMTFSSILGAAFFVLMGLGGAWAGVYVARANHGTPIGRRWPKAQTLRL